jgi:tagatose-1,6-bisphosphate aldolase non-catalytic subunit AgaZ/GatZ
LDQEQEKDGNILTLNRLEQRVNDDSRCSPSALGVEKIVGYPPIEWLDNAIYSDSRQERAERLWSVSAFLRAFWASHYLAQFSEIPPQSATTETLTSRASRIQARGWAQ